MVSQYKTPDKPARRRATPIPAASSRERILAAASAEFAARGFDGAKVDRIAKQARLNKAMLYYHFKDKAALYRAIIEELFGSLAAKVVARPVQDETPDAQMRWLIRAVAAHTAERPHFPAIWLREMAEGGRHLDPAVASHFKTIVGVVGAILADGRARGIFQAAHPLITQMAIVAPLLLFDASQPVRQRLSAVVPSSVALVERAAMLAHVERAPLSALMLPATGVASTPAAVRPRRSRS